MDPSGLASGDNNTSRNISSRAFEEEKFNPEGAQDIVIKDEELEVIKDNREELTSQVTDDNEVKIKERIAQCRSIIESLKLELNEEKTKLEEESKMSKPKTEAYASTPSYIEDGVSSSQYFMKNFENINFYGTCVDHKLNYDENLMEYEKQLQKYQNTLNMAQIEKKNAIRKQMLSKAYKLKLLEVENQCNIELLRVKQSLQCLEPLQMIANKWNTSSEDTTYDLNSFVLIPRYPELGANSGSDVNSAKDDNDSVGTDKPDVLETGC